MKRITKKTVTKKTSNKKEFQHIKWRGLSLLQLLSVVAIGGLVLTGILVLV